MFVQMNCILSTSGYRSIIQQIDVKFGPSRSDRPGSRLENHVVSANIGGARQGRVDQTLPHLDSRFVSRDRITRSNMIDLKRAL